jgi:hypothetical protein
MLALAAVSLLVLAQTSPGEPAAPPATAPDEVQLQARPPAIPSLLSAEPLRGTSAFAAEAGWSRFSLAYAQGLTERQDLGGFLSFDVATTELRLGALYRQSLPAARPFDAALRLSLAWYHDSGGRWIDSRNHLDRGIELGIGYTLSRRGAGGVVSILADAPITITLRNQSGLVLAPRVGVAYETPLYGPLTVGVRGGAGYRFGVGSAPFKGGLGEVTFLAVATYRVF